MWGSQHNGYWVMFKGSRGSEDRAIENIVYGYVPAEGWTQTVTSNWEAALRVPKLMQNTTLLAAAQMIGIPTQIKQLSRQVWTGNNPLEVRLSLEFFDGMKVGEYDASAWKAGVGLQAMASPGGIGETLCSPGPPFIGDGGQMITVVIGGDVGGEGKSVVSFKRAILQSVSVAWSSIISRQGEPTFAKVDVNIRSSDVRNNIDVMGGVG